jgi:hypothetical protein
MSYGLQVFKASGALQFDSSTTVDQTLLFLDLIVLASGASTTATYAAATGRTIVVIPGGSNGGSLQGQGNVSYPSGVPTLTLSADSPARSFEVFVQ